MRLIQPSNGQIPAPDQAQNGEQLPCAVRFSPGASAAEPARQRRYQKAEALQHLKVFDRKPLVMVQGSGARLDAGYFCG